MDRFSLIKRNTEEILTEEDLKTLLKESKSISSYYGTAPTGPYHMGYLVPLGKLFDFDQAKIKNKILIADLHACLDDLKAYWDTVEKIGDYYEKCIELSFPWENKPTFVRGSSFQLKPEYILDMMKISSLSTVKRATRAASEVTRMKNPKVSELIYPVMQALDEQYLEVDIQLGGIDQRHIMAFAREYLPKLNYKSRIEVMTPLVVSLKGPGVKMSASDPSSHIKVYDSVEAIKTKINKAYCVAGEIEDNPIYQLCKFVVFPVKGKLKIERDTKFGGDIELKSFEDFEKAYIDKRIHPTDLKLAVSSELGKIFSKVRGYFEKHRDVLEELGKNFLP